MATKLLKEVLAWLEDYKKHTGCKGVVLGISGGKDSTTVAMLATKVWGRDVVGVLMPNGVQAMSAAVDGLVETSLNLGILKIVNHNMGASEGEGAASQAGTVEEAFLLFEFHYLLLKFYNHFAAEVFFDMCLLGLLISRHN